MELAHRQSTLDLKNVVSQQDPTTNTRSFPLTGRFVLILSYLTLNYFYLDVPKAPNTRHTTETPSMLTHNQKLDCDHEPPDRTALRAKAAGNK